jgi:hypothetical protein
VDENFPVKNNAVKPHYNYYILSEAPDNKAQQLKLKKAKLNL